MAYTRLRGDFPTILKRHKMKVVEVKGWRGRGRPGNFQPVGVLWHHTASTADGLSGTNILVNGRPDLKGPLSQFGLGRDGTVYIVADGKANHAGPARASGSVAAGEGNALYWGIEAFNTGTGEKWPKAQLDAYIKLTAILCVYETGNSWRTVSGHKETSKSGKIDPYGISMPWARARVSQAIKRVKRERLTMKPGKSKPKAAPKTPRRQSKKSLNQLATEVILGKWGVGADRIRRLKKAGHSPAAVQAVVNRRLQGSGR